MVSVLMQKKENAALKQQLKEKHERCQVKVRIFHYLQHITMTTAAVWMLLSNHCLLYDNMQEHECIALKLNYESAKREKEEAKNELSKLVRLK